MSSIGTNYKLSKNIRKDVLHVLIVLFYFYNTDQDWPKILTVCTIYADTFLGQQ